MPQIIPFSLKGKKICLSEVFEDITLKTSWYKKGYTIENFSHLIPFNKIKNSVTNSIKRVIRKKHPDLSLECFKLENYHKFISAEKHINLDKIYKRLYPKDFGFDDNEIVNFIGEKIGRNLSYKNKSSEFSHWIIVRINMPLTTNTIGFNPAHKDIYEDYDKEGYAPRMVNTWIPICGVNKKTGLPLAKGSHLIKEDQILRTKCCSFIENQQYSVNCIKSWGGKKELKLISPKEGELLIFSSHLIHGLGKNNNLDQTRVSLEFRLHEK